MANIVGIAQEGLSTPVVSTVVLKDTVLLLSHSLGKMLDPHEVACQLCLWSRSDLGSKVKPIVANAEVMAWRSESMRIMIGNTW